MNRDAQRRLWAWIEGGMALTLVVLVLLLAAGVL